MMKLLKNIKLNKSGASAAEYALMLAIMGAVVVTAMTVLGGAIGGSMDAATATLGANKAGS